MSEPSTLTRGLTSASPASPRRWLIAGVLFIAVLSAFFDRISIAILFTDHSFQNEVGGGMGAAKMGLLMTVFVFAYGISGVLFGFVGDVFGAKRSITVGAVIWGVSMLLIGSTSSFTAMLFYRALLGMAEGPQFSLTNKLVKQWFPPEEQARANAMWLVGSPLGSAIGFALTLHIVAAYGWRSSFMFYAALNLLVVLPLVLFLIKDRPETAVAPASAAAVDHEPYMQKVLQFIKDWRFWMLTLFNTCALIYLWGLNSWLPSYLVRARHFDLHKSGVYAWLPFVTMFLGMVLSSWLSDKLKRRALVCAGSFLLAGVSMWLVIQMPDPQAAAMLVATSSLFWGAGLPPQFALALRILPARAVAAGVGVHNGLGNVISAFSPLVIGALIQSSGSFDIGLTILPVAALIGSAGMATLIRGEARQGG